MKRVLSVVFLLSACALTECRVGKGRLGRRFEAREQADAQLESSSEQAKPAVESPKPVVESQAKPVVESQVVKPTVSKPQVQPSAKVVEAAAKAVVAQKSELKAPAGSFANNATLKASPTALGYYTSYVFGATSKKKK